MPNDLKCYGAGRDGENPNALLFCFNRPVTDAELRYLHDVLKRAAECNRPKSSRAHLHVVGTDDTDA